MRTIEKLFVQSGVFGLFAVLALSSAGAADSSSNRPTPDIAGEEARQLAPDLAMAVRGTIDVAADGTVLGYVLADEKRLPQNVRGLIAQTVAAWRFNALPAADEPAPRYAFMNLTIGANQLEGGNYLVYARDAYFHTGEERTLDRRSGIKQSRPAYPDYAVRKNISGTVHLILKADLDGNILDVVARRVDLDVTRPKREEERGRESLAKAAIRAARHWHAPAPGWPEDGPATGSSRPAWSFRSSREATISTRITLASGKNSTQGRLPAHPGSKKPFPNGQPHRSATAQAISSRIPPCA